MNTTVSLVEYARLDRLGRDLPYLVRASVHDYNNEDDLARRVEALPSARGAT